MTTGGVSPSAVPKVRIAVMRLARRLRNERQGHYLTASQTAVLATLLRTGPMTPATLAATERVQPPAMTRIVTLLEQGGWVEKQPHPYDRRQVLVRLTPQGEAWARKDREDGDSRLAEQMAGLAPEDRDVLVRAASIMNRLATAP